MTEMKITRRAATDLDIDFARDAHHRAYRDVVTRQFGVWDEADHDEFFDRGWASAAHDILLCDGVPCGYVSVDQLADYNHVRLLVVLPEYQGRGIGSAFLWEVIEEARSRQVPVKLRVLRENRALQFYKRFGFRQYDRTETHILMEWNDKQSL